ncbi:MAG: GIY-YIG nuclease family protein, partial [Deltaproteobacteria bacterium]|nr:GIY-YIG nuclease family protein [Deltaproteobacteria bacterium]
MNANAKTIQIFLPAGDPRGIRVAEITTRIVQVIEVPRSLLQDFLKMDESAQVAVYFLFGTAEEGGEPRVYIGQTGDLRSRLVSHNHKKDVWERALVLVSRTNSLTQTHGLFLEWYSIQAARRAGRYTDENGNSGSKPHTPPPLEADCLEIFETGRTLLATLGFPLFEPLAGQVTAASTGVRQTDNQPVTAPQGEEFYCKVPGVDGRGLYTAEGFVVLKGSVGRREDSTKDAGKQRFRRGLIAAGVLREAGDTVV